MLAHPVTVLDIVIVFLMLAFVSVVVLFVIYSVFNAIGEIIYKIMIKNSSRRMREYTVAVKDWMETGCRPEAMPKY